MFRNKFGFTLLELIVAMSVTVVLFSLGFVGIISLRRSLELRNGYNDVASRIRELQNLAKNVVSDEDGDVPTVYLMRFDGASNFSLEYCFDDSSGVLFCEVNEQQAKSERFSEITITSTCDTIGFERRTANLVTLDPSNRIDNSQQCVINVGHTFVNNTLTVDLNTANNIISYE